VRRLLLVDDYLIARQGLKQVLKGSFPDAVFGDAASGEEAIRKVRVEDWDAVILDISLPDKTGFEVLKELKLARPKLPVLILSMHSEEQFAVRALRAGASGYLNKASPDLLTAVSRVLSGGRYVSPALAERLAGEIALPSGRSPHELLSDREFQVFRLLASGKTVTAIAKELNLSVPTISTHRARILEKMGMTENADLVQYAIVNRIFD
jgi:two-component system invasion response regulator UvrY